MLRMGSLISTGVPCSRASLRVLDQLVVERLVEAMILLLHAAPRHAAGHLRVVQDGRKVDALGLPVLQRVSRLQHVDAAHHLIEGAEAQSAPCSARTCSAMKKKKLMTFSGVPWNLARSAGSCVAMPTGQVFRWHLRIMMQPMATSGAVEKPNSSAPSSAAMVTSRPVCNLPSVCTRMRPRRSFITSTWCVSAKPSSHGTPACLMELSGDAPVPPVSPADQHHVGMRFGNAGRDRPHADFSHQLHRNARLAD